MKTLSRYVIKEHFMPFIGGLAIIMFVLVMDFILDILNLIIAKGVQASVVIELFVLNLSWMLALAVPMACLLASLMAFGRLTEDGEITATRSSGIPLTKLMIAPGIATLLLSGFMIYFSNNLLPEANYKAKMLMGDIKRKKPTLAIKERVFIDDFPGFGLYIEEVDQKTGQLIEITIYDQKDRRVPRIVQADSGKMEYSETTDALTLNLFNGTIHEIDEKDPTLYTKIDFDKQTIRFTDLGTKLTRRDEGHRGDRELNIAQMKERIADKKKAIVKSHAKIVEVSDKTFRRAIPVKPQNTKKELPEILNKIESRVKAASQSINSQMNAIKAHKRYIRKYKVEIHKKITLPLACFFFFLIGAPVGVWTRKGGVGIALGFGLGFFVIYWAFLIGGEELADRGFITPWFSMWAANIVMTIFSASMLYRNIFSSHFSGLGFISTGWKRIMSRFAKKKRTE